MSADEPLPRPPSCPSSRARVARLPEGDGWAYEPKWDGFRAIAFVDGDEVELQSRNGKPLTRYFPEVTLPARALRARRRAARRRDGHEDFDLLGQRIHPAASRIARLAEETPARFVAFDLLALRRRGPARAAVRASAARRSRSSSTAPSS